MVSQYNISDPDKKYGIKNIGLVVGKRIKMQGFIVVDANMYVFSEISFSLLNKVLSFETCLGSVLSCRHVLILNTDS